MNLTKRAEKGSKLTIQEGDDNLTKLYGMSNMTLNLVNDFGCKPDGVRFEAGGTMTSGSPTFTLVGANFTSADIGKLIYVRGAGSVLDSSVLLTTVIAVVNSTTITLANNASQSTSTGSGVYGTDNTTMLQDWADFVSNNSNQINTDTYAPRGIYCIGGNFTATSIGQINFSKVNFNRTRRYVLRGAGIPEVGLDVYDNTYALTAIKPWTGTVFLTMKGGTSGFQFGWIGSTDPDTTFNITYGTPVFQDITFRCLGDYGRISGLNAYRAANLKLKRCAIDHDINFGKFLIAPTDIQPTYGVIFPAGLGDADNTIHDTLVGGFTYGMKLHEHCSGDNVMLFGNVSAIALEAQGHNHGFGKILEQWCRHTITVFGNYTGLPHPERERPSISINQLQIETDPAGGRWYSKVSEVEDPNNLGSGVINYSKQHEPAIVNGAKHWKLHDMLRNYTSIGGYDDANVTEDSLHVEGQITSKAVKDANFADDAAAATGGIPVGGFYHTSGTVKVRLS